MPNDKKSQNNLIKEAMDNIKQKIESGEWGQKEINEYMLKLRDEYIKIIGHLPKGVDFSIYEDTDDPFDKFLGVKKEKDKKD